MKKLTNVNILWQCLSDFSSATAKEIALLSPDKFVINVDGPGSTAKSPINPPSIKSLVNFVSDLENFGYKGELVMHPNCDSSSYEHDWNGKGNLPTITAGVDSWNVYLDYFNNVQSSLLQNKTKTFDELLIETENSYFTNHDIQTFKLFPQIRAKLDKTIKLSSTGGWNFNWERQGMGMDCYYIQMYDMCDIKTKLPYPNLGGVNTYSKQHVIDLVNNLKDAVQKQNCNVNNPNSHFIFTFCDKDNNPPLDPPMFSTPGSYWTEDQFTEFITKLKQSFNIKNVGVWPCESVLKHW